MRHFRIFVLALLTAVSPPGPEAAAAPEGSPPVRTKGPATGLPLPRFVSLKFDKVHLRRGPGFRHRIDWDYVRRGGMPVEIIAESEHWRRIRDAEGTEGWVHASQLSDRRGVIVTGDGPSVLRRRPDPAAAPVALVEPGLIGGIRKCSPAWCRITVQGYTGWLQRSVLWGLYPHEEGID
ncbi:MAG: SH3 domain-containing protein [Alphaproteobacteria bacterium]